MFENIKWKRGSNELAVVDAFTEIARKASEESGAEVLVVLQFPDWGSPHVVASTPEHPSSRKRTWTFRTVAAGMKRLESWVRCIAEEDREKFRDEVTRARLKGFKFDPESPS